MRLLGLVPNTNKIKIALRPGLIHACENMDDSNKESFSPNSSQLVMSPMTATTADIDKRILLLTGKNHTMWAFWMILGNIIQSLLSVFYDTFEK